VAKGKEMNRKHTYLTSLLLSVVGVASAVIILTSCHSITETERELFPTFDSSRPRFEGTVFPISVPVAPRYLPAELRITTEIQTEGPERTDNKEAISVVNRKITSLGNSLVWESKVTEIIEDGKVYKSKIPFSEWKWITNHYGRILEVEFHRPAFDQLQPEELPSLMTDLTDEEFDELMTESMKSSGGLEFTNKQVTSGGILRSSSLMEELPKELKEMSRFCSMRPGKIKTVVKGWSYLGSRKVLVADMVGFAGAKCKIKNNTVSMYIRTEGYELFDALTFHTMKSETLTSMLFKANGQKTQTRMYTKDHAETIGQRSEEEYGGRWIGEARHITAHGEAAVRCLDASISFYILGGIIKGRAVDSGDNEYELRGTVSEEGEVSAGMAVGEHTVASFSGELSRGSGTGSWETLRKCSGTWQVRRQLE